LDVLERSLAATLGEILDGTSFREVCESYYSLFDVPLRIFDTSGDILGEAVHSHKPCQYVNNYEVGKKLCTGLRSQIKKDMPADSQLRSRDCICGLRYTIVGIEFQKEIAGKLVLGPYLPVGEKKVLAEMRSIDRTFDAGMVTLMLDEMRTVSDGAIRKIVKAMLSVLEVILFSAHKAHITSEMHIASMRDSFRELADKNRQLEDMAEQMKEFERLKSNFLATVSHELRTPLTSIIGYSDMLAEGIAGELGEEQKQFVQTIKTKGDELLKLISSILDFSRIETGHLDMHWQLIEPEEVVETTVESNQELAERRGARLALEINEEVPPVYLDPEKITKALGHLIENALKFSAPGGLVKVSLRMIGAQSSDRPGEEDGFGFVLLSSPEMLEISVEDFGAGIADGDQNEIFLPFVQLDNSSTREHGGSGLGLAVVKHYVEAHGGQVHVQSRVGEGSRFALHVPIVDRG